MNESELYKELGALTKDKDLWEEGIPYVSSLLAHESVKIQAKALWLLGEMGLAYPQPVEGATPALLPSATVRRRFCGSARSTLWAGSDGETIL